MNARTGLRVSVLTLGLTAILASAQVQPALSVTPNPAPAGKPFVLYLQGLTFDCFTTFARESVSVKGNRIDLIYTTQAMLPPDPPVPRTCPVNLAGTTDAPSGVAPIVANLPMFPMPALAAGKYEVWASNVPECIYSGCLILYPAPVSAGTLEVRTTAALSYTFTPTSAAPGQAFDLHLLSYGFTCATVYENLVVQVAGNAINLSFLDHERTGVACPAVYMPYGPTFKIPALPAGTYEVRVDRGMENAFVPAGNLRITASVPRAGWYLKERIVPPDNPFTMRLLKDSLPACVSFSNLGATAYATEIDVSFLMTVGKCALMATGPMGPAFAMPALKNGVYPIYVTELLPCEVSAPFCAVDRIKPLPSDTLVVAQTLRMRMSALRAGAPKAELKGNTAYFALPEGKGGVWRAELMTLDGRVLAARSLAGAPGERVSMPIDRAPAHAVSLLKLTSAEGSRLFLPIVR